MTNERQGPTSSQKTNADSKMKDAALAYAAKGWPIFAVKADKTPYTENGVLDATTNPQKIEEMWARWPNANIALDVGGASMMVLDLDPGHSMEELEKNVGPVPVTQLRARTPRGGAHLYLAIGEHEVVAPSASKLAPHVDVRSFHSYVLLPPSATADGAYAWEDERKPAYRTDEILRLANSGKEKHQDRDKWIIDADLPENVASAIKWLREEAKIGIVGQGGDHTTYATAAHMRSFGISQELAIDLLWEHWCPRCSPPWSPDDIDNLGQKVENAYCYAISQPGNITPAFRVAKNTALFTPKPKLVWNDGEDVDWEDWNSPTQKDLADLEREREETLRPPSLFEAMQAATGNDVSSFPEIPLYDLDELASLPAPEWDMKWIIGRAKMGMIVGMWGQYKTFIALDMAISLAGQLPWPAIADIGCKQYTIPKHRRVLYIAAEGGAAEYRQRLEAALENRKGIELDQVKRNFVLAGASAPLDTIAGQRAIADVVERATKKMGGPPEVIFCDTLAKSMAGEENSNTDMGKLQRVAAAIQRMLECSFIFIHHTGKGSDKSGRGASSMPAGLDFQIHVDGEEATKVATVNVVKQKDAPAEKNIILQGRIVGNSLAFTRVSEKPSNPKDLMKDFLRQSLVEIIEEHEGRPLSTTQLVEKLAPAAIPDFDTLEGEVQRRSIERLRSQLRRDLFDPKRAKSPAAEDFRDSFREGQGQNTKWRFKDFLGS